MRTNISSALIAMILFVGCKSNEKSSAPFPELAPPPAPPTLLAGQPPPPPAPFESRMKDHAALGITMRDAVMRGDLEGAKRAGNALAELPIESRLSAPQKERLDGLIVAAQRARAAQDTREAAHSLAAVAASCGGCHTSFGGPHPVPTDAPADEPDLQSNMLRHRWGAARLWEGLAAPSDKAWKSGAQVLSDAPFPAERLTPEKTPVPEIGNLAKSVHDLGRRAGTLEDSPARVEIYGELMTTCASCHERLGRGPAK